MVGVLSWRSDGPWLDEVHKAYHHSTVWSLSVGRAGDFLIPGRGSALGVHHVHSRPTISRPSFFLESLAQFSDETLNPKVGQTLDPPREARPGETRQRTSWAPVRQAPKRTSGLPLSSRREHASTSSPPRADDGVPVQRPSEASASWNPTAGGSLPPLPSRPSHLVCHPMLQRRMPIRLSLRMCRHGGMPAIADASAYGVSGTLFLSLTKLPLPDPPQRCGRTRRASLTCEKVAHLAWSFEEQVGTPQASVRRPLRAAAKRRMVCQAHELSVPASYRPVWPRSRALRRAQFLRRRSRCDGCGISNWFSMAPCRLPVRSASVRQGNVTSRQAPPRRCARRRERAVSPFFSVKFLLCMSP